MGDVMVVAGLFWRHGKVLVQQRPAHKALGSLWEFPGGKVERGESEAAALRRECVEELAVDIQVGPLVWQARHDDGNTTVHLRIYQAAMPPDAIPALHAAAALAWRRPAELAPLVFCPADVPLVAALMSGAVGPWPSQQPQASLAP